MYKLIYECEESQREYSVVDTVTMELSDDQTLDEMLDVFQRFLQATGYNIEGQIEHVKPKSTFNRETIDECFGR
jgi:hypothetical protein